MLETPKGFRTHIAILGRRNAGKSTFLNTLSGQTVSIVSPQPGTTTDPVEKTMELAPLGPVVLLDTAGMDDEGNLGAMRVSRSRNVLNRIDAAIIVCPDDQWEITEKSLASALEEKQIPFIIVRNRTNPGAQAENQDIWRKNAGVPEQIPILDVDAKKEIDQKSVATLLAGLLNRETHEDAFLLADLLPENGLATLVVPLDSGAPKGRLILPQMQAIRELLDNGKMSMVTTQNTYKSSFAKLACAPDLVVCDSQVVDIVASQTPPEIPLTTFSILMARYKGNLPELVRGAKALLDLKPGDKVMVQEACSHHPQADDIGRVKIPRLLTKMAGGDLDIEWIAGKEFLDYDNDIKAIIHCGACVLTRSQMLARMEHAHGKQIPITNYGMTISMARGVLERVLSPFPKALEIFRSGLRQ